MEIIGKKIVLTGKFSEIDRKEAEHQLKEMGAICSGSVSAKTDILFAGEKAGSKLSAATKLGVAVFGESDLMMVLGLGARPEVVADDADILQLLADGKAEWVNNTPHKTDVVTFGMSNGGEYFATGAWCGDDYDAGGSLAIWETATGRCVNVVPRVQGGAGWPDYGGCIQWSHDDRRVGLAFDTNGVGYVDPFGNVADVDNCVYATDGWSRPPGWCWAPDSARVFVSCWGYQESSLAGCIGAPSAYDSRPVYMAKTGEEGSEGEQLQPFVVMVWASDDRVVGYNRHGAVYAIDTHSRSLLWQTEAPGPVAISPDGALIACHDRGLKWLDGKTGEVLADPKFVGGGDLVFSPNGEFLLDICYAENKDNVTPCVRVYRGFELLAVLDCEPGTSDSWRRENVQAKISLDGTLVAVICADGVLRVFKVADEKEVFSLPANGTTDLFFGVGNLIVLACDERLIFVEPTGEVLISHELKEVPVEEPLTETLHGSNLSPFENGERWGYATGGIIVAEADPEKAVQAVAGRRKAFAPSLVGAAVYTSLDEAVAANPKAFSKSIRDLVKKTKTKTTAKSSKFPPANMNSVRDVEDYLLLQLDSQDKHYTTAYKAEIAITRLLASDLDGARRALVGFGQDSEAGLNLAHVAAYAARSGHPEYALELVDQASKCDSEGNSSNTVCRQNYVAVATRLMGKKTQHKISLEFAQGEWESQERMADTAVAHLMVGDVDKAFEQIQSSKNGMWWHHISEFICLLFQTDDVALLSRFTQEFQDSEHIQHFEVMERLVARLMELDAHEQALESLSTFSRLSVSEQVIKIVDEMSKSGQLARFERLADAVRENYDGYPSVMAELVASHNRASPEDSEQRILDFLSELNPKDLNQSSLSGMVSGLVGAMREAGLEIDALVGFARALNGGHWAKIWAVLPDGHAIEPEARERTLASYHYMGSVAAFRALLDAPERFETLFARGLEVAGRDRYNLGYLGEAMCKVGDLERANIARMKIPKGSRSMANEAMVYALLASNELSAGLQLAAELDHGFGSSGREYTLMRGLVRGPWGSGGRTSHVM
jgi:hypothetical protein